MTRVGDVSPQKPPSRPGAVGALVASDPTLDCFGLRLATQPDSSGVGVRYTGIPGNRPETYGNTVALWDTWAPVITGTRTTKPLRSVQIPSNLQPSSVYIPYDRFTGTDYLVTYQVSNSATTMVAALRISLRLPLASTPPAALSLSVYELDSTSVTIKYETLGGCLPHTFGNWVGIWVGFAGPYAATKPAAWAPVVDDNTMGLIRLAGLAIVPGFDYRVIYFMGPQADGVPGTNLGAMLTFKAVGPAPQQP